MIAAATPAGTAPVIAAATPAAAAGTARVGAAVSPAAGADRLDRIAGALRGDPFYVDPEAAHALPAEERAPAARALAATGVPVYTVVVPLTTDDESEGEGEGDAFLHALHDRLGRDGVYLVADEDAEIEAVAFGVPREVAVPDDVARIPLDDEATPRTAGPRLLRLAELLRTAPAAAPESPNPLNTPVLDDAAGVPDLAGALVLIDQGRRAHAAAVARAAGRDAAEPVPPCFFNPLHGDSKQQVVWRPLGQRRRLKVRACHDCAQAIRGRRAPEVLADELDGREVP
ncbi:MAG: hypothetical protein GEV11_10455 [Streptosporangiales bacterium]|nr:hypothetical protein [Streptosporangiales bacterium]